MKIYELKTSTIHLNSTSFYVHVDYHRDEDKFIEYIEPKTIKIIDWYSRYKRQYLK